MSQTLRQIRELAARREVHGSDHGYDELAEDNLFIDDTVAGIDKAVVVEDYPTCHKGFFYSLVRQNQNGIHY
jgi:hypothetical protein